MIFNMGGGAGLNLKVKAYESFPVMAEENTIGVVTEHDISRYVLSNVRPETDLVEGELWIKAGCNGPVAVPVGGKKNIYVYPAAFCHYVGGEWVEIDSANVKCYQDGWKSFRKYIYENGDKHGYTYTRTGSGGSIDYGDEYMDIKYTTRAVTNQSINISGYTRLVVEYDVASTLNTSDVARSFGLHDTTDISDYVTLHPAYFVRTGTGKKSVLSLDGITEGSYFLKMCITNSGEIKIYKIYME